MKAALSSTKFSDASQIVTKNTHIHWHVYIYIYTFMYCILKYLYSHDNLNLTLPSCFLLTIIKDGDPRFHNYGQPYFHKDMHIYGQPLFPPILWTEWIYGQPLLSPILWTEWIYGQPLFPPILWTEWWTMVSIFWGQQTNVVQPYFCIFQLISFGVVKPHWPCDKKLGKWSVETYFSQPKT